MDKYGVENFDFYILEECQPDELDIKEIYWIINKGNRHGIKKNVLQKWRTQLTLYTNSSLIKSGCFIYPKQNKEKIRAPGWCTYPIKILPLISLFFATLPVTKEDWWSYNLKLVILYR